MGQLDSKAKQSVNRASGAVHGVLLSVSSQLVMRRL